jgi:hypothetical protein
MRLLQQKQHADRDNHRGAHQTSYDAAAAMTTHSITHGIKPQLFSRESRDA